MILTEKIIDLDLLSKKSGITTNAKNIAVNDKNRTHCTNRQFLDICNIISSFGSSVYIGELSQVCFTFNSKGLSSVTSILKD